MNEDRLLGELGDLARRQEAAEKARLDERWDRLAAGTLTDEEEAELRALAETSDEAREAYDAFRPLGADFQARVADAIAAELERPAAAEPEEERRRVLPFPPALRVGGWVSAAAAATVLYFLIPPINLPPLPEYTAELSGGVKTFRGETSPASGPPLFVPGSLLHLKISPSTAVTGKVEARGFLGSSTGQEDLVAWEPDFEILDNGVVTLRGSLGPELRLPQGSWTVWVVVGRKGRIPSASELQYELRAGRTQHADWQAVCADLRFLVQPRPEQWQVACANLHVEDRLPP